MPSIRFALHYSSRNTIPLGPSFWEGVASVRRDMYERGDKVGATDAFLTAVVGPDYRQFIAKFLPPRGV
jgi:hypothetical protein